MGLKNDRWIRERCLQDRMIEPFEDRLVRRGMVSFGLSSYGYDIRVAREFKVFQPESTVRTLSGAEKGYLAALLDLHGKVHLDPPALAFEGLDAPLLDRVRTQMGTGSLRDGVLWVDRPGDVAALLSQLLPFLQRHREDAGRLLERLPDPSIVIDPKNFHPGSFVDVEGDVCVVPPNSFALARSVEYFRIPRGVFGLVVGKSTYARCGIIVNITPLEPEWEGYLTIEISNTTPLPARIYAGEGIAQVIFLEADEPCEVSYADRQGKYQKQVGVTLPRVEGVAPENR